MEKNNKIPDKFRKNQNLISKCRRAEIKLIYHDMRFMRKVAKKMNCPFPERGGLLNRHEKHKDEDYAFFSEESA